MEHLRLYGFNNLTKNLSFNLYDICYAEGEAQKKQYIQYIDEVYNAARLTEIVNDVTNIIGASILNIAYQDYDPQGASVTMLISETPVPNAMPLPIPHPTILGHLDKSHIAIHTYPESHPHDGVSTFRVDIDVSTCGVISPLKALNYLIQSFDSDIITVDYRVRGFTRNLDGHKLFIDHPIQSIREFLDQSAEKKYRISEFNLVDKNIFHLKMNIDKFCLDNYLFGMVGSDLTAGKRQQITHRLQTEIHEILAAEHRSN